MTASDPVDAEQRHSRHRYRGAVTRADGWTVDLRPLGRQAGSQIVVERTLPAPDRMGPELVAIQPGSPMELSVRLEAVTEGVLVSGTVTAPTAGECVRCLRPIAGSLVVRLQELYAYLGSTTDETSDADEVRRISDDRLELLEAVRDAVVLDLPLNPLCRADCRGLCSGCGEPWDDLPADHTHEVGDPRWAVLRQLADGPEQGPAEH